jgi:3-dehydroquinate synthase
VLASKQWFIEIDEFDQRERRLLNFGHTFGHAIESAVGFAIPHGVGVVLGIRAAIAFGAPAPPLAEELDAHCQALLEGVPGLADAVTAFDADRFQHAFRSDKKHRDDEFHVILPATPAGVEEVAVPADDQQLVRATEAVRRTIEEVSG